MKAREFYFRFSQLLCGVPRRIDRRGTITILVRRTDFSEGSTSKSVIRMRRRHADSYPVTQECGIPASMPTSQSARCQSIKKTCLAMSPLNWISVNTLSLPALTA